MELLIIAALVAAIGGTARLIHDAVPPPPQDDFQPLLPPQPIPRPSVDALGNPLPPRQPAPIDGFTAAINAPRIAQAINEGKYINPQSMAEYLLQLQEENERLQAQIHSRLGPPYQYIPQPPPQASSPPVPHPSSPPVSQPVPHDSESEAWSLKVDSFLVDNPDASDTLILASVFGLTRIPNKSGNPASQWQRALAIIHKIRQGHQRSGLRLVS